MNEEPAVSRPANLKAVADLAGVAVTTVTRVIYNKGYVAEDTRERVLKAVEATGYRVNSIAQTLKRNRSYVIGHLLRSTVPNPFFVKVARGVEEYARSRGYATLTYNVQNDVAAERQGIDTFLGWRADAVVFSTPVAQENVDYAVASRVPVVQVERPRSEKGHRITVNNYAGAMAAMRHLVELGHRRIAYVGEAPGSQQNALADYVEIERFGAYREVMLGLGGFDDRLVRFGAPYQIDLTSAQGHGYQAARALLADVPRPTAILCSNDILAAGALQAIHEAGLRVPDDISIIGFDDTLAEYLSPLLTSVRLPARRLGQAAARLVIDDLEGAAPQAPAHLTLEAEFMPRQSTAAPR
jgi:LacI family transcriptional regulator